MSRLVEPVLSPQRRDRWLVLALLAATLLAFWPSLFGDFLWDDDGHVTQPQLRSLDGLVKIWTEPAATQQYYPLLHSAFWIEYKLWGDHALGYRLLNILLHATSACLFAALLRRLAVPGAWFAAFIFALHPVCVESVAWISEQKNTLSLVLYLAAALAYLRFDETRRPTAYFVATAFFVAALLSKTVTATLPAALLVVLAWKKRGLVFKRDVLPLVVWVVLGLGAGVMTIWNERTLIGAKGTHFDLSFAEHVLLPGRIIWFYLGKLVWPAELSFFYPRWTLDSSQFWQWLFPFACLALTAVLIWRKRLRGLLVPWLLFVGTLFPALGFFNVYPFVFSYVADHFQYHASLAIIATAAAGLVGLFQRLPRRASLAATFALPLVLGFLTFQQSKIYVSSTALYEDTLEKNPDCWLARNNLGQILTDKGELDKAIPYFQRALKLNPGFAEAENNLGYTLRQQGKVHEAIPHFERAIALQPKYAQAHNNLGLAFISLGDRERAIASFRDATRSHPRFPLAHFNLGLALAETGKPTEAFSQFERALQLDPNYAPAEFNWAIGLMQLGRFPEAIPHFEKAIQLDPTSTRNRLMYSRALAKNGRFSEAIDQCQGALEIDPDCLDAHVGLANMLKQIGRLSDADYHLREAQRLQSPGTLR